MSFLNLLGGLAQKAIPAAVKGVGDVVSGIAQKKPFGEIMKDLGTRAIKDVVEPEVQKILPGMRFLPPEHKRLPDRLGGPQEPKVREIIDLKEHGPKILEYDSKIEDLGPHNRVFNETKDEAVFRTNGKEMDGGNGLYSQAGDTRSTLDWLADNEVTGFSGLNSIADSGMVHQMFVEVELFLRILKESQLLDQLPLAPIVMLLNIMVNMGISDPSDNLDGIDELVDWYVNYIMSAISDESKSGQTKAVKKMKKKPRASKAITVARKRRQGVFT